MTIPSTSTPLIATPETTLEEIVEYDGMMTRYFYEKGCYHYCPDAKTVADVCQHPNFDLMTMLNEINYLLSFSDPTQDHDLITNEDNH